MKKHTHHSLWRIIAMALCLAILLPTIAVPGIVAQAGSSTVTILACSDFQGEWKNSAHNTTTVASNIKTILSRTGRTSYDGFLFLGDYNLGGDDGTVAGLSALKKALKGYSFTNQYYIQGNHDAAPTSSNGLTPTGGYDTAHYGVYTLNWADYGNGNTEAEIQTLAANLKTWLDGQTVGKKPIFVISHLPLHYTPRVYSESGCDAQYAKYLVDVLNAAGQRGLNIIYMYGHNHSAYYDNYLGGSTNFVTKGETLWISDTADRTYAPHARTINFAYMNAGYIGSIGAAAAPDTANTMSVFEINGEHVTITRYDKNGVHELQKYAGQISQTELERGYTADINTCQSPYTVYGNALNVSVPAYVSEDNFGVGTFATMSVSARSGYTYTWESSNTSVAAVRNDGNGQATISALSEGVATITVTESGTGRRSVVYVSVKDEVIVDRDGMFYQLVDSLTPGKNYILADSKNAGLVDVLKYESQHWSGLGYTTVRATSYNSGTPVIMQPENYYGIMYWQFTGANADGFGSIINVGTQQRLEIGSYGYRYTTDVRLAQSASPASYLWNYNLGAGVYSNLPDISEVNGASTTLAFTHFEHPNSTMGPDSWFCTGHWLDPAFFKRVYAYEEMDLTATAKLSDTTGRVAVGANGAAETGSMIVKTWKNGRVEYIPVTVDMLVGVNTAVAGTYTNVDVYYNGIQLCDDYTLTVGNPSNTIPVAEGYYYRLTDGFTKGASFSEESRYLILNRNAAGSGKLMESWGYDGRSVKSTDVVVRLDADGVPCVQSGDLTGDLVLQEWWYHAHYDQQWYLWQPNWSGGTNNYLRIAAVGGGDVVTGGLDIHALRNLNVQASTTCSNYLTARGALPVANNAMTYLQYDVAKNQFVGVLGANRIQGQEVSIYEKVTYNTATCDAVGSNGTVALGSAATAKTGTCLQITRPDGTVTHVDVTANMLYKNGKQLTASDLRSVTTLTGLTLKYQGVTLTDSYTLSVAKG